MDLWESDNPMHRRRSRTLMVLGLLTGAALLFSWLGAYAVTNALVGAGLMRPWPPDRDPRPEWMLASVLSLLVAFLTIAGLVQWISRRQLRRIDAAGEGD